MSHLTLLEAPAALIEVPDARAFLRITDADASVINDDELIARLIATATACVDGSDGLLGRALGAQRWRLTLDTFPAGPIELPLPPLISVDSITYADPAGVTQTLGGAEYRVSIPGTGTGMILSRGVWGWPATALDGGAVSVEFKAGYQQVPAPILTAILQHVALLYENRETAAYGSSSFQTVPFAGLALVDPYRMWAF